MTASSDALFVVAGRAIGPVEAGVLALALVGTVLGGRMAWGLLRTGLRLGAAFLARNAIVAGGTGLLSFAGVEALVPGGALGLLGEGATWLLDALLGLV